MSVAFSVYALLVWGGRLVTPVRRIAPRGVENGVGHWPLSSTSRFNL